MHKGRIAKIVRESQNREIVGVLESAFRGREKGSMPIEALIIGYTWFCCRLGCI